MQHNTRAFKVLLTAGAFTALTVFGGWRLTAFIFLGIFLTILMAASILALLVQVGVALAGWHGPLTDKECLIALAVGFINFPLLAIWFPILPDTGIVELGIKNQIALFVFWLIASTVQSFKK